LWQELHRPTNVDAAVVTNLALTRAKQVQE
jgi:hypothetical protein